MHSEYRGKAVPPLMISWTNMVLQKRAWMKFRPLKMAVEMEETCVRFYAKELKEATNDLERKFLQGMLNDEREHRRMLTDMQTFYSDPEAWFMEKEHPHLDGA